MSLLVVRRGGGPGEPGDDGAGLAERPGSAERSGSAERPGIAQARTGRPPWRPWRLGPHAVGLVVPVVLLVGWQAAVVTRWAPPSILPPPVEVVGELERLLGTGELWRHLGVSVRRVLLGFACGGAVAVATGLLVGLSRSADRLLSPTLLAARAIPSLAWVPLLILWFGIGELPKVVLIAIGAFFPVLATLVAGIRQVDPGLLEVARSYGLSRQQTVRTVLLPTAAPSLLAGARLGLAQAWLFLVAAELIASSQGLGFLLVDSQNTGRVEGILLAILLLALVGKATDLVLAGIERRVLTRLR